MSQHDIPTIGIVLGMGGPAITGRPFFAVDPHSKTFIITDGKHAPHTADVDDYADHVKAIVEADSVVNFHRDELSTLEREIERITVEHEIITGQLRLADTGAHLAATGVSQG